MGYAVSVFIRWVGPKVIREVTAVKGDCGCLRAGKCAGEGESEPEETEETEQKTDAAGAERGAAATRRSASETAAQVSETTGAKR